MNSAQVHCSRKKNQNMLLKEKKKEKKKEGKRTNVQNINVLCIQTDTNIRLFIHINFNFFNEECIHLILFYFILVILYYYTYLPSQPHISKEIMSSSSRNWMLTKIGKKCKIKNWQVSYIFQSL